MGDVPRSEEEKTILKEQISKHNKYSSAQFVIHVGDIKSGNTSYVMKKIMNWSQII